jgi:ADP-ribose pyrophosphatase YjhB (NUDIX family)
VLFIDSTGHKCYLIKEATKAVDFVGGKLEFGESPEQALIREIKEEIDMDYTPEMFVPLGYSDDEDEDTFFRSYLFVARGKNWGDTCVTRMLESPESGIEKSVVWLPRLVRDIFQGRTVSMLRDILETSEGTSNGKITEVHEILMRESKIREGRVATILQGSASDKKTPIEVHNWAIKAGLVQKFDWYHLHPDEIPTLLKSFKQPTYESQGTIIRTQKGGWNRNYPYTNPNLLLAKDPVETKVHEWSLANKFRIEEMGAHGWSLVVKKRHELRDAQDYPEVVGVTSTTTLTTTETVSTQTNVQRYVPPHARKN